MTNIIVGGPILPFLSTGSDLEDDPSVLAPADYLWARELAERAAAKSSTNVAARRIHQQLAQLYAGQRRCCAGDGGPKS
jgi:hypothetical protein